MTEMIQNLNSQPGRLYPRHLPIPTSGRQYRSNELSNRLTSDHGCRQLRDPPT